MLVQPFGITSGCGIQNEQRLSRHPANRFRMPHQRTAYAHSVCVPGNEKLRYFGPMWLILRHSNHHLYSADQCTTEKSRYQKALISLHRDSDDFKELVSEVPPWI